MLLFQLPFFPFLW